MALPDVAPVTDVTLCNDTIARKNFSRGLWSAPMLAVAVKKGVLTPTQVASIKTKGTL
jgi:hypothetical protein